MPEKQKDIADLNYEEGMAELEKLVERLEARDIGLEESLAVFERGHALQQHLFAMLKAAELRIEKITAAEPASEVSSSAGTEDDAIPF